MGNGAIQMTSENIVPSLERYFALDCFVTLAMTKTKMPPTNVCKEHR